MAEWSTEFHLPTRCWRVPSYFLLIVLTLVLPHSTKKLALPVRVCMSCQAVYTVDVSPVTQRESRTSFSTSTLPLTDCLWVGYSSFVRSTHRGGHSHGQHQLSSLLRIVKGWYRLLKYNLLSSMLTDDFLLNLQSRLVQVHILSMIWCAATRFNKCWFIQTCSLNQQALFIRLIVAMTTKCPLAPAPTCSSFFHHSSPHPQLCCCCCPLTIQKSQTAHICRGCKTPSLC